MKLALIFLFSGAEKGVWGGGRETERERENQQHYVMYLSWYSQYFEQSLAEWSSMRVGELMIE